MEAFNYEENIMGGIDNQVVNTMTKSYSTTRLLRFLDSVNISKGKFLEVGCGGGTFTRSVKYYRPNLEVHGCDISKRAILKAKEEKNFDIKYKIGDGQNLPYPDAMFEIAAVMDVLEHVENPKQLIKESHRVLKKGGKIHICVPCENNRLTFFWLFRKMGLRVDLTRKHFGHIQKFKTIEIVTMLRENGFIVEGCSFSGHLISQLIGLLDWYLPQELLFLVFGKETAHRCKDHAILINKNIKDSHKIKFLLLLKKIWFKIVKLIEIIPFYESKILINRNSTAMTIHLTAQKN